MSKGKTSTKPKTRTSWSPRATFSVRPTGRCSAKASRRGVNATPTILVNGRVEPSALTVQGLLAAVDSAVSKTAG